MPSDEAQHELAELEAALKKAASALGRAQIPFLVGGSVACWVRGGPEPRKDVDLMLREADAERALALLESIGMRPERPPENWLLKAWEGDVLIDLIFHALGLPVNDDVFARAEEWNVFSMQMKVASLEDVITTKLLALNEQTLDFRHLVQIARAVRERVDWQAVQARTDGSPYARGFFALLRELEIIRTEPQLEGAGPQVRVLRTEDL
jgi:predicted nucleotidyltransferase